MDTYILYLRIYLHTAVRAALHGGSTFSVLFPREVSLVTQASETRSPYLLLRVSRVYDIDSILSIRSQELHTVHITRPHHLVSTPETPTHHSTHPCHNPSDNLSSLPSFLACSPRAPLDPRF